MTPDPRKSALAEHQRWLGHLQPEGLVVSPAALVDSQILPDPSSYARLQDQFLNALGGDPDHPALSDFPRFATSFLGWQDELFSLFSVTAEIPDGLRVSTGEHGEILQPDAAYRHFRPDDAARPWLLLIRQLPPGTDPDALPDARSDRGWIASPHQKFERLLRETNVPIGLLCSEAAIRLIYAPRGENAGWLTFPVDFMASLPGRPALAALHLLLSHSRLVAVPEPVRLPALLRKSRDYQANVSTDLSTQVLEALFELARGFQAADEKASGHLLATPWAHDPQQIYGGLITSLLRMVFLLYAEDRGLMPSGDLYQRNYSVQGLYDALRSDHERYPDTMDVRFAAWPRLLALFRAIHSGCRHRSMSLPARKGHLFDPDRFPFLEGRSSATDPLPDHLPRLSDGTLHRVLSLLLYLDGERLSYRTLDVEQIGSVYETIMGFAVEKAKGRMIALKPKKSHGAPLHISLDSLLASKPADREKFLLEHADTKLPDAASKALRSATSHDDLLAALDKRIDRRATPHPVPQGSLILQPTDERRRSGSHYTPRSFTEPIVRKTLEPILDRLGRHPLPDAILNLKVADIAVGSAAFLVEVCRQLADELVSSWHFHKYHQVIPPDEDELLFARRLVAQRCLYGVDRNPMAVDLAKLSLWLATMAKDHPFTFLDHSIKCGDSLVGLSNHQIAAFHWDPSAASNRFLGQESLDQQLAKVTSLRLSIASDPDDSEAAVLRKQAILAEAETASLSLKTAADLVIAAFFAGDKPKERQQNRDDFLLRQLELQNGNADQIPWQVQTLKDLRGGEFPIRPFHWELEFPEVFSRENPGFDAIAGNPPFLGSITLHESSHTQYTTFLRAITPESGGKCDLVAFFFRRAYLLLREPGCFGLIATNTISQGSTRASGLRWICTQGGNIYAARSRHKWPGQAVVVVSIVWVSKSFSPPPPFELDGKAVSRITAYLFSSGGNEDPAPLPSNKSKSFVGVKIYGQGFLFSDERKDGDVTPFSVGSRLLLDNSINESVIKPYIGGEEINEGPIPKNRRLVIDFGERSESEAAQWIDAFRIVEEKVKPERLALTTQSGAEKLKKFWWRYYHPAKDLYKAISSLAHVLACSQTSKYLSFAFLPSTWVYGQKAVVLAFDSFGAFCILQSRSHSEWADFMGSSMKDDPVYTSSVCFETFPFPRGWETNAVLEAAGKEYYEFRAALMIQNDEGLTKTYNRFHDPDEPSPDIQQLRALHAGMDRAVLDAYGWTDIPTTCQFLLDYEDDDDETDTGSRKRQKKKPWRYRWPDDVRDEVLARLLALNAERHAEEVRLGIAPGMKPPTPAKKKRPRNPEPPQEDPDAFALM